MATITGDLSGGEAAGGYNPSMYELLKTVNDPAELRRLDRKQLPQLADELRAYVSATRSRPADFADFAARDHLHTPAPPAGKAYAISFGKVILVDSH